MYQGEDLHFTCNGLQRITGYNFRLSATNEKGQGPTSPSVTYSTRPNVPRPPGAPTSKERATHTSLHVEWQPPSDDGGSPVLSYTLQMDEGERSSKSVGSSSTSRENSDSPVLADVYTGPETCYKAEGLKPGRRYQFQVSDTDIQHLHVILYSETKISNYPFESYHSKSHYYYTSTYVCISLCRFVL